MNAIEQETEDSEKAKELYSIAKTAYSSAESDSIRLLGRKEPKSAHMHVKLKGDTVVRLEKCKQSRRPRSQRQKQAPSLIPEMLTLSETESLRQDKKDLIDYGLKVFAKDEPI